MHFISKIKKNRIEISLNLQMALPFVSSLYTVNDSKWITIIFYWNTPNPFPVSEHFETRVWLNQVTWFSIEDINQ